MSTLAKLVVELGLDSSQFSSGIQSAQKQASGLGNILQTAAGTAIGFVGAMAGTAAIGTAFSFVKDSAIGMNATLETSTLQFQTLMGSADVATEHVKGLFQFAKETPFETQPIIDASAQLQVFGGATLNTMANLTLFGDAAAATTKPLQEISFWSGRMYAALQAGKPIGEAVQNLQQLGVISPQVINQLEAMSKSGASADEMWKVFTTDLGKFSGAMKLQAGTWQGLTSSISDSAKMLTATAFKPLFDVGKRTLEGLLSLLGRLEASGAAQKFADGLQFVIAVLEKFGSQIIGYGKAAFAWGQNIANQFAAGIAAAINAIVSVLKQIGSVIASWLRPGSPPKITPELDEWGKQAGTVYIDGWAQADFGAFDDLSRSIESSLKGLVDTGKFDQRGVIPTLLAGRQGISAGLSEIAKLGEVSQATFDGIVASLGPAGGAVGGLVRAYFDLSAATRRLEAAQEELNRTTQKYADMLAPLNAQMQQLQDQAQHIRNLQRIEELNATLADSEATQYEKDLAANELQQIALQESIDGIEAQRDAEIAAAQAKVDTAAKEESAAKARIDQQQAMLDATNSTNALIAEQASLLESLAKSAASGGGTGGAGGLASVGTSLQEAVAPMQAVSSAATEAKAKLDAITTSAQAFAANVNASFQDALVRVQNFGSVLQSIFGPAIDSTIARFQSIAGVVNQVIAIVQETIATRGAQISATWGSVFNTAIETVNSVFTSINGIITTIVGQIAIFLTANGQDISNTLGDIFIRAGLIIQPALQLIAGIVQGVFAVIVDFVREHGDRIQQVLTNAWTIIKNVVLGAMEIIGGILRAGVQVFQGDWQGAWETIQTMSIGVVARLKSIIEGGLEIIAAFFDTSLTEIANTWRQNFEQLPQIGLRIAIKMLDVGIAIVQGIQDGISRMWSRFTGWIQDRINEIPQAVRDVLGIHSPSTVFAEIGMQSVAGIQAGWNKLMPALQAALGLDMTKLSEKLQKGVQDWLKHISEMFKSQASLARSMYTTFGFLRDFEKATKSQALQDAQDKYNNSRERLLSINEKLAENEFKMRDLAAETALTTEEHNKRANELAQERNALLNEQAHATNDVRDASIAQDQAQAKANQQQAQLAALAEDIRKQYAALENQVSGMINTDATGALNTYNTISKQIQEMAELRKQLITTSDPTERSALETQIRLLQATQGLETQAAQTEINLYARDAVLGMEEIVRLINEAFQRAGISADIRLRTT